MKDEMLYGLDAGVGEGVRLSHHYMLYATSLDVEVKKKRIKIF